MAKPRQVIKETNELVGKRIIQQYVQKCGINSGLVYSILDVDNLWAYLQKYIDNDENIVVDQISDQEYKISC